MSLASGPLVSIVMPVYNGSHTLTRAIASLQAQTVDDWEALVVDDGSTDTTPKIANTLARADPRLRYIGLRHNRGRGEARSRGLAEARGLFLAMLDADDWWYPWKLERQLAVLESSPEVGLVTSSMASEDQHGELAGVWRTVPDTETARTYPPWRRLHQVSVAHAPSVIRMPLARRAGYERSLRRSEDGVFLGRVLSESPYVSLSAALYAYTAVASYDREGALRRYGWAIRARAQLIPTYPVTAALGVARAIGLAAWSAIPGAHQARPWHGSRPATQADLTAFTRARHVVSTRHEQLS